MELFIVSIVVIALAFDYVNGMHDAANAIASVVSTRVMSPRSAVLMAAFANFIAFLFFGVTVAATIGKGIISPSAVTPVVVFAALIGAIGWDLITWYFGVPVSSSHALIGGLLGAAVFSGGLSSVQWPGLIKVAVFIVVSPLVGLVASFLFMCLVFRVFRRFSPSGVNHVFSRAQIFSAFAYSLGHGGNDAQKTMGIISVLLFSAGYLGKAFYVPLWVVLASHAAMGLGTLSGGWRIVKTMGHKITKLRPVHGFVAETASAGVLFASTFLGVPVSTTHVISASIMGVGSTQRARAVKWGVARRIVWAWVLTIPLSALFAGVVFSLVRLIV